MRMFWLVEYVCCWLLSFTGVHTHLHSSLMVAANRNKSEHYCSEAMGRFPSGHLVEPFLKLKFLCFPFTGRIKAYSDSVPHVISVMTRVFFCQSSNCTTVTITSGSLYTEAKDTVFVSSGAS